jgi:hypothetical protein
VETRRRASTEACRVRTAQHIVRRSASCTRPPGRSFLLGIEALGRWKSFAGASRLVGRTLWQVSLSLSLASAESSVERRRERRCPSGHPFPSSFIGADLAPVLPPLRTPCLGCWFQGDAPGASRFWVRRVRGASASYPIGWIHRHHRRSPAASVGWSANAPRPLGTRHRENPTRQASVEALRRVSTADRSPPILPDRRLGYYVTRSACRVWHTARFEASPASPPPRSRERSLRRPQPSRAQLPSLAESRRDVRCHQRVATRAAAQHARRLRYGPVGTGDARSSQELASHVLPLRPVDSMTNHRVRPRTKLAQTGLYRTTTWNSARRCCHHRPDRDDARKLWKCAGFHRPLGARAAGRPTAVAPRSSLPLPAPASRAGSFCSPLARVWPPDEVRSSLRPRSRCQAERRQRRTSDDSRWTRARVALDASTFRTTTPGGALRR